MSPPHEKLAAWKFCHELALAVRTETRSWSPEDRALASQIRRASFSAAANLVEGCAKRGSSEFRRFLDISLGSLSEVEYALRFALDAKIMNSGTWEALDLLRRRAHGTTRLLYNAIRKRIEAGKGKWKP